MSYTPTNWVDGTTPVNAALMNKIEQALDTQDSTIENHDGRLDTVETEVDAKLEASAAGAPLGVATLDATGKVPAAQLPSVAGAPIGSLVMWAGSTPPAGGWLLCDGAAVSRATYATLFSVIGTTYGTGDGTSTFNLPDLRGRIPVGVGSHADVDALGDNDGAPLPSRRPKHKHTVNDPGHSHGVSDPGHSHTFAYAYDSGGTAYPGRVGNNLNENHPVSTVGTGISVVAAATGATVGPQSAVPQDGPAYLAVNYLIKA